MRNRDNACTVHLDYSGTKASRVIVLVIGKVRPVTSVVTNKALVFILVVYLIWHSFSLNLHSFLNKSN